MHVILWKTPDTVFMLCNCHAFALVAASDWKVTIEENNIKRLKELLQTTPKQQYDCIRFSWRIFVSVLNVPSLWMNIWIAMWVVVLAKSKYWNMPWLGVTPYSIGWYALKQLQTRKVNMSGLVQETLRAGCDAEIEKWNEVIVMLPFCVAKQLSTLYLPNAGFLWSFAHVCSLGVVCLSRLTPRNEFTIVLLW